MWSGVNMLKNCLKISDTSKKKFSALIFFRVIKKYDENTAVEIYAVFHTV